MRVYIKMKEVILNSDIGIGLYQLNSGKNVIYMLIIMV